MDLQLPEETWVSASTWPIETALGGILDASIVGYLSTEVSTLNNISRIIERNITDEIDPFYFYQTEQFTVLWLLFSVIVVGNTSVLVGLIFGKRRKSRMNFFIKQLAFADLMVGLISVLTDIVWRSTVAWYAGNVACKIIRFMQVVVTYSSTYVLVALSIDRYDAITRPMNFSRSWCRARALVTAAWSISVLFSVPIIFLYEERIVEGKNQCWIELGSPAKWRIYMTVVCLTLFIIPAIIIGGCYMVIVWTIWSQSSALRHDPTRDTRRASSRGLIPRAKIKTVKMTFVIVFVAVVTGGLGGIGSVTVKYLLTNGAKYVAILDVHESHSVIVINRIKELENELGKGKFTYYVCDVTKVHNFTTMIIYDDYERYSTNIFLAILDCFKQVIQQQNHVDILINCAGFLNDRQIDLTINTNFKATVNCTLVAIDHMGKHKGGKGGVVVNIASILGLMITPAAPIYAATKHAIISFVRSMEGHNETLGVRIVCLCPHLTDTSLVANLEEKNLVLDFCKDLVHEARNIMKQKPETVASAIIEIIKKGKPGAVWITEKDEQPRAEHASYMSKSRKNRTLQGVSMNKFEIWEHTYPTTFFSFFRSYRTQKTLVFILCWSPYIVFDLLQVYGHVPRSQTNIAVATFIQSLAPLNSAANPIIYCLFSTPFCKTVRNMQAVSWFSGLCPSNPHPCFGTNTHGNSTRTTVTTSLTAHSSRRSGHISMLHPSSRKRVMVSLV
ncbi:hypothetical protein TSAR_000874 [Trichomalopsis sarcophagae]|uniref:G-protein coupled receptors family 1 profile domain-containing protein n=1 Tax=Trichomalopsis sarcophagae TaxID=543379 RepID=A0A232EZJ2_9HYME|nr:hypothetical protein TSAR_000874 [Trichomalopsis sarcophagae]